MPHRSLAVAVLIACATMALRAQATHFVGPNGLPQINDALAIAAPGDVILVEPLPGPFAAYDPIVVTVGVTIRPLNQPLSPHIRVRGADCTIPAGQQLHCIKIWFSDFDVRVSGGRATFDLCTIAAPPRVGSLGRLDLADTSVHLQDTTIATLLFSGGNTVFAFNSSITATGTVVHGLAAPASSPPAIWLINSRFHATGCAINASSSSNFGSVGIRAQSGSSVWLSDSTVNQMRPTACAIESVASTVRVDRSSLSHGTSSACTTGSGGFLLGVQRQRPLMLGQPFALDFRTENNGIVFVFASLSLGTVPLPGLLEQPTWFQQSTSFHAGLLVAGAEGLACGTWQIPGDPIFANVGLWFEGISGQTLPLQVSPPVGGIVR